MAADPHTRIDLAFIDMPAYSVPSRRAAHAQDRLLTAAAPVTADDLAAQIPDASVRTRPLFAGAMEVVRGSVAASPSIVRLLVYPAVSRRDL